jgi:hypothetical protein
MTQETANIKCPNCGHEIDVNEILYRELHEKIKKEFNSKLVEQQKEFEKKYSDLKKQKEEIERQKSEIEETIEKGVKEKLSAEKIGLEKKIRDEISTEKSEEIKSYKEQLQQKIEEAKELNKTKAELERIKREKEELKEKIEAEAEIKLTQKINEEKDKFRKEIEDKVQLKVSEKNYIIEQLKEQLKEAQRKAEQGSIQIQGEVQELAIEEWLKTNFPLDTINEIKKGVRGADCIHIVNTRTKKNCGSIYYESKRTKDFQPSWIEKFKTDMREKGATFGLLVTDALPKDMERLGQKEGLWICTFEEFKGLCFVLRESVVLLSTAIATQENKSDKMSILYGYLTGSEFRMQVEAIVEGFTQMHKDLEREKRAMEGIWKKREKQIQKVLLNTNHMYNSIKGIAGNAVGTIKALELPEATEDINEETDDGHS